MAWSIFTFKDNSNALHIIERQKYIQTHNFTLIDKLILFKYIYIYIYNFLFVSFSKSLKKFV
jgi:hypothetical protein